MTRPNTATARVLRLADGDTPARRILSAEVKLAEGVRRSVVTVTRTGSFFDPRYGNFDITATMLAEMVRNFEARAAGQDVFIDVDHKPGNGAAAKVVRLFSDGNRLRADVEWTDYGVDAVRNRGFSYLSAEFHEDFHDNESGKGFGCVLLGAGLTIRPVIKRLDPVQLAVAGAPDFSGPVYVFPGLARQLTESQENTAMNRWKKLLAAMAAGNITLSDAQLAQLKAAFDAATKHLADDADDAEVIAQFVGVGKALADATPGATVQLSVNAPAASVDDATMAAAVQKVLAERETAANTAAKKLADVRKAYTDAIDAAEGLDDAAKTAARALAETVITEGWNEASAKVLAEQQIESAGKVAAARRLAQMGFSGTARFAAGADFTGNKLSEDIRKSLAQSSAAQNGGLHLLADDKLTPFARRYLEAFDGQHAHRLAEEQKALSGGPVNIGDTNLPATFQREVIREALSDLNVLQLVDAAVDLTTAATHTIPFESRDTTQIRGDGIVYEGQPIPFAGVSQSIEYAYVNQVKIALNLTNEVIHFTANNPNINWDAWGRNIESNARVMRELLVRRIANTLQRVSDGFGAVAVTGGAVAAGTVTGNYKFANWPVVRPHQARDLQGNAVGSAVCPLVVKVAGSAINEYDGTGTQSAGNYYRVVNWNLGLLQVVNQAGVAQGGLTVAADYWYATNVAKFDLDPGAVELPKHLNGLLRTIGARKALMATERYVTPNAALMSPVLNDVASNAEQFTAIGARADSGITALGDLLPVKGIPSWQTNQPGIDLGEDRIQLLERGLLRYRIAKPYAVGAPFEAVDASTGKPLGKKIAYGEEYSSIHVPGPLRGRMTAVIAYSGAARTAF